MGKSRANLDTLNFIQKNTFWTFTFEVSKIFPLLDQLPYSTGVGVERKPSSWWTRAFYCSSSRSTEMKGRV